jgi:hypothetical protein
LDRGATLRAERSEGLVGDWIHVPTFDVGRVASRGSGDSLIAFISVDLRWPISIGPIRSKSGVRPMDCLMLAQFQGSFVLAKIKL